MKNYLLVTIFLLSTQLVFGQLSSLDIRQVSGKGPYPIYFNLQFAGSGSKNTFRDFAKDYANHFNIDPVHKLWGFEGNFGVIINDDNFLGIRNFRVRRFSLEVGYRYLDRTLKRDSGGVKLLMKEEVLSLRAGIRGRIIYPITYQVQLGPSWLNFASVREKDEDRSRNIKSGDSLVGNLPGKKSTLPGLDARLRLMFIDPVGTSGGLGFYFEVRYLNTFGKRFLTRFHETFIPESRAQTKSWDYFSYSIGFVAPLALPLPSS